MGGELSALELLFRKPRFPAPRFFFLSLLVKATVVPECGIASPFLDVFFFSPPVPRPRVGVAQNIKARFMA